MVMVIMESHNFLIFYGKHRNSLLKTILIFSLIENLVESTTKQIKKITCNTIEILYYPKHVPLCDSFYAFFVRFFLLYIIYAQE